MIAVLVNGMRDSRYVDSADGQRPVETVIVKDLLPHIDNAYRTNGSREGRAIEGYSMGGFGAARLGFKFPGLFGAVSIMAGALMDDESAPSTRSELFQKNFGGDLKYFRAASPWTLVENNADGLRGRTFVRIGVGKEDNLLERNEKYHKLLERLGIEHEFFVVPGVAHNGALFYKTLGTEHFRFYDRAFQPRAR
jgi:endo-1,4-beta-xylanase